MPRVFLLLSSVMGLALASILLTGCPPKTQVQPAPDFMVSAANGTAPFQVQFFDRSQPGSTPIHAWSWSFGDGTGSTRTNPMKTYSTAGEFTVSLTITTSEGNFTRTVDNLVKVTDPTTFGELGEEGGSVTALGVTITVPEGALKQNTAFGVAPSPAPVPLPTTENTVRASDSYTIRHSHPVPELYLMGADGKVIPTTVRIPTLGSLPANADTLGQIYVLAQMQDGRTLPIPAHLDGASAVARVMRLPGAANYTVAFRPNSQTLRARDVLPAKEEPVRDWADTWLVSATNEMLQQLTALRFGDINNEYSFGRRDFPNSDLETTGLGLLGVVQSIHDEFAASGLMQPALIEENDAYSLLLYNLQRSYPSRYDKFSGLCYYDDFFGHLVLDPGQMLAISTSNAATLAADAAKVDQAQILDASSAYVEGLYTAVYRAYGFPNITTVGDINYGIPAPADRDAKGNVRPVHFLEGLLRGGATYLGQRFDEQQARSFEAGQYADLSQPLLTPYSATMQDYAQAGQEFYFYLKNHPDDEDPLALIAGTLEGLRAALDELPGQGEHLAYLEAFGVLLQVMDEVLENRLPSFYWDYARDRAFENTEAALIRPSDADRPAYTLNRDRLDPNAVISANLESPSSAVTLSGTDNPTLANIAPLCSRALVLETNAVATEVVLTFNAADWVADEDGNTMALKVYKQGMDGVELNLPAGAYGDFTILDADEDGLNDTITVGNLSSPETDCGQQIVVVAANLNLAGFNSISMDAASFSSLNIPEQDVLSEYVHACDPAFSFKVRNTMTIPKRGLTAYVLEMTSGVWRGEQEVNQPQWRHFITIVEPSKVTAKTAMLMVSGGSTGTEPSPSEAGLLVPFAEGANSVVALLDTVPNEPLVFSNETRTRTEDAIIAYSYDKYITLANEGTPDKTWPVLLPMARSAVRAMDAVQQFMADKPSQPRAIEKFVVAGASKRGWTTWLTAASDSRVSAIIPIVIDVLGMDRQMTHHRRAYSSYTPDMWEENGIYGGYSIAIKDYVDMNVFQRFGTPAAASLLRIVDPFTYRAILTMPKLIANSTGDQFFLPDSSQFYLDQLPGDNHIYYAPNTDHGLGSPNGLGVDTGTLNSIRTFYTAHIRNTNTLSSDDVVVPHFTSAFEVNEATRRAKVTIESDTVPSSVKLWQAVNPEHRDFRLGIIGAAWTSTVLKSKCELACGAAEGEGEADCPCETDPDGRVFSGRVIIPEAGHGWRGFFVQVTYPGFQVQTTTEAGTQQIEQLDFAFSTPVKVVPEVYPDE